MMLKYVEFAFVFCILRIKVCLIHNVKIVKINFIKNAFKTGLNLLTKVNVLCVKQISFKNLNLILFNIIMENNVEELVHNYP